MASLEDSMSARQVSFTNRIMEEKPKSTIMGKPATRYMFFTGKGGVGKTSLALRQLNWQMPVILFCW